MSGLLHLLQNKSAHGHAKFTLTFLAFGAAVALLVHSPAAFALDALDLTQYAHTAWTAEAGFKGTTRSIVQTPDGYLWLGTEFGLVRFDGVRFVPWIPPPGERLPSSDILSLVAARDGTLWIGTLEGLSSWNNGRLLHYPEFAHEPVLALLEDQGGTVWVGGAGKICAIRGGSVECHEIDAPSGEGAHYGYGNRGQGVYSLYEDNERRLWAATESGLWQWTPGPPRRWLTQSTETQQALAQGDHSTGLIAITETYLNLRQITGEKTEEYVLPGFRRPFKPFRLLRDRHGALWIGTSQQGVLHVHHGKTTQFAPSNGLSGGAVQSLFEDREGTIWVGTTNGLDRFREPAVFTVSAFHGLSIPALSVLSAHDGSLWIGGVDGVNRWNRGQVTIYRSVTSPNRHGPAAQEGTANPGPGELHEGPREVADPGLPSNETGSLLEDQRGRVWVSTSRGVAWFENGRFTRALGVPVGIANAIIADKNEGVWISYPGSGLFHVVDGRAIDSVAWPWSHQQHDPRLSAIIADPVRDGLWLGFLDGGIAHVKDGQVDASIGNKNGLGAGEVWHLYIDRGGTLWVATQSGLSRVKEGSIATLTTKNGLPCDAVRWVMEDDVSSLWLYTACGLLRISQTELGAWASNPNYAIHTSVYDSSDGIRLHELINGNSPVVTKSVDGKLWFAHSDGVSAIDPRDLSFNRLPPPVHIEQISADGKTYGAGEGLRLPPRVRDLSIDYTALSLVAPEKVRFRYKLEGQDLEWKEVLNSRHVQYSNLAPGSYRFRVIASNNSGLWNEHGDSREFSIAPAYWQSNWFRTACVLAFAGSLWLLYRLRLRHISRQFALGLEARVAERTRIARDLHDTLLQSFQGLLLQFQTVWDLFSTRPAEAKEILGGAIDQAADAITEGRKAVQGLRSSAQEPNDLEAAIGALGEELATDPAASHAASLRIRAEGPARPLHPIVRDEIYRIAAEALRNAFQHSQGTQIEVELRYDEHQFRLRVRDDGIGIDANVFDAGGREGHYGLQGMRERADLVGGKLSVSSAVNSGTKVELTIAASRAYVKAKVPERPVG
ncbi:MAG TPA: two-component regulator propeller domain-containing protein [Steroidobacteraceae bacterium]|nr:two-component regulator propeller domain-containing protein [Steroidobacteraceae bacterium]